MNQNNDTSNYLNDASYIYAVEHIVGPWHQYDFTLTTRGYGWDYILSSAKYMIEADLCNLGTISVVPLVGSLTKEYIKDYRANGGNLSLIEDLNNEASSLGIGGMSKVLGNMALKIIWLNQTNLIRIMTPVDDDEFMISYVETVIRRSFGTVEALKKGKGMIKRERSILYGY